MTVAEVSAMLKVAVSTVYGWASEDRIPHAKLGSALRFDREKVKAWVRSQSRPGRARRKKTVEIE